MFFSLYEDLKERDKAAKIGQLEECITADVNFHIAVAEASKNDILVDLYRSASIHLQKWFLKIYKDTSVFIQTQLLHEQLVRHIIAGDSKKAWNTAAKIIDHI